MGPVEEGGKIANAVIDSLRSNPLIIGILALNLVWLLVVFWVMSTDSARDDNFRLELLKACMKIEDK